MPIKSLASALRETRFPYDQEPCSDPERVTELMNLFIGELVREQECFLLLTLTSKLVPICLRLVHIGTKSASLVDIGVIYRHAIIDHATSIIVGHNHPSGDPEPSNEDIEVTAKLKEAGQLLGIELLDHVIFGDRSEDGLKFFSLQRRRLL